MKISQIKKHINYEYILLSIILIFALFIRLYNLSSPSLWIDEFISVQASKSILSHFLPVLDSNIFYSRALLFHYSQAFLFLFSISEFTSRLPSVFFGLLTILLAYFIGKEYSKSGGLISALFMSVFYLEVFFSRQARFYQLFQLFFFLSIFLLYKSHSKNKKNSSLLFLSLSLISLFITINIQVAGLVLAPFFIIHILLYNRKYWYLAILPAIPIIYKSISLLTLTTSTDSALAFISSYSSFTANILYLLILFIPSLIFTFLKNKKLTLYILLPSLSLLLGIFFINLFALRYQYFFVFPLVLFPSLFLSILYDKYGKLMLLPILILLIVPSNLFFPLTYTNVIKPVSSNYNDPTSPEISLSSLPPELLSSLQTNTLITYFSPAVEFYIKKPDFVLPFSMSGAGEDTISTIKDNLSVDVYSGAPILSSVPQRPYYLVSSYFALSKLKPNQVSFYNSLTDNCSISYQNPTLIIHFCPLTDNIVTRVIDGDTFILSNNQSVRLICIDAPELPSASAIKSKEYLESLILNRPVILEKDISETDAYNRLLRYAYINNSVSLLFINKALVSNGFASPFPYPPDVSLCENISLKQ